MRILLYFILIIAATTISVHCFEFYTTAMENRYKFRYWFAIGIVNIFHILLAIYGDLSGDYSLQSARWASFALMDVLLLEIFVSSVKGRRLELFIRSSYYVSSLASPVILTWIFPVYNCGILIYLALKSEKYPHNRHFAVSFILYALTTIVPTIWGFGTNLSFFMGVLFLGHLMYGVHSLYRKEKVYEHLQKNL